LHWHFYEVALHPLYSRSNWNLEVLIFVEGGKLEYPEKNPPSRVENQQQTQSTYDAAAGTWNRTRDALVGGERSRSPHVPCFYRVIETRVEVWENEKSSRNTSRRRVFPQLFGVLENFHECFYNSIETRSTCSLFLLENIATRKRKATC